MKLLLKSVIVLFLSFFLISCEASVLPRAKICIKISDYDMAVNKISKFLKSESFDFVMDSSHHDNTKNLSPRFIHWKNSNGINLSIDDYSNKNYILLNVYEERKNFSDDGVLFYEKLSNSLKITFGEEFIDLMIKPEDAHSNRIENICKFE